MTNNKQSSVEYLIEQIKSKEWQDMFIWHKEEVFEQVKQMEKQQIIKAVDSNFSYDNNGYPTLGEQYYNETYNNESNNL